MNAPPTVSASRLARVADGCALAVAVIGLAAIAGWVSGLEPLTRVVPPWPAMQFNAAVGSLLGGVALWRRDRPGWRAVLGLLVAVIGALTLAEHISGRDLGVDQLFVRDTAMDGTGPPGRLAPMTSVAFVLGGAALALLRARKPALRVAEPLALGVAVVGLVSLFAYAAGTPVTSIPGLRSIALPTATALFILGIGLLCAAWEAGSAGAREPNWRATARLLWLGFGVLAALMLTLGVVSIRRLQVIALEVQRTANVARVRQEVARQLQIQVREYAANVRADQAGDTASLEPATRGASDIARQLAEYERLAETMKQRELAANLHAMWREIDAVWQARLVAGSATPEQRERLVSLGVKLADVLDDEVQPDATAAFEARRASVVRNVAESSALMLALLVAGLVIALFSGRRVARAVLAGEEALHRSHQRFALVVEGSGDGVWDWNIPTSEHYFSPRWKALLGFQDQELPNVEESCFGRLHPEDLPKAREAIDGLLAQRTPCEIELRMRSKDDVYQWFLVRAQAAFDDSGRPVRVAGMFSDISHRKAHDTALERHLTRARQMGQIATGEFAVGMPGLDSWSAELYDLLGCDPAQGPLSAEEFIARVHAEDRDAVAAAYRHAFEAGTGLQIEYRIVRPDGALRWLQAVGEPLVDDAGRLQRFAVTLRDITDTREMEAKLRDQAVLAQMGQMTAVVAHEVRNPLAGMGAILQVLQRRTPSEHPDHELLSKVLARLDDLRRLTDDLLDVARARRGTRERSSLRGAIEVAALAVRRDPAFGEEIQVHIDGPDVTLSLDTGQFIAVLQNLILNAAQAMNGKGVIQVTTGLHEGWCHVTVEDQGPGIPPDIQDQIFEPFFTTRKRGTGLGLAFTRHVVEAHDGVIHAQNSPKGGAIFRIVLPAPLPTEIGIGTRP